LLVEKFLNKAYSVIGVGSKGQGKSLIVDELKENRVFDLIILDIPSGDNKSTFSFLADIRKNYPHYLKVGVVALTSRLQTDGTGTFSEEGILSVVNKPIMRDNLETAINRAFQPAK